MVKKQEWQAALDDLARIVNAAGSGAFLFDASARYHRVKANPNLLFALKCAGCTANIYLRVKDIAVQHFAGGQAAPQVSCKCGHSGDHTYIEIAVEE